MYKVKIVVVIFALQNSLLRKNPHKMQEIRSGCGYFYGTELMLEKRKHVLNEKTGVGLFIRYRNQARENTIK